MSAVRTSITRFKPGMRAVLVRHRLVFKGTLFKVAATPGCDDAYWMIRQYNGSAALAIHDGDEVYTSSPAACFACTPPGTSWMTKPCASCFDRYL